MKTVHKSVLIWHSAEEMFDLVTDVARYPEFLPWCDRASVAAEGEHGMKAEIGIAFGGIHQTFTTHNEHVPGREVTMKLLNGPFSRLDGQWKFSPLGTAGQHACKVELELNYGFNNAALGAVVGPVFDKIAGSMVEAFVKRAEQVYGGAG
jgi:ribosome-associated toxin RatA of RatAB toxin-antitoxin module